MTPRLPGAGHLRHWQMVRGEIPGSRVEIVLTCQGLRPRQVHVALAVSHPMMLPSVNSTTSAPGNLIYISWLNGWPVNTPVNASPHTSRYATHDSGTLWIAGPSMVGDFHPLISTGLPAHTVYTYSIIDAKNDQGWFCLSIRISVHYIVFFNLIINHAVFFTLRNILCYSI